VSSNAAFHLKDIPDPNHGRQFVQGWLRIVNTETAVLAPWFELQAECARQFQAQAIEAWWSWWPTPIVDPARQH
jgi:hypothetical protein